MLISVCICTYNRSEILSHCLHSLSKINDPRPGHDIEIVVIDNNSSDDTSDLVRELVPIFPFTIRYAFEGQQGISTARNRAVLEAKGDYLVFLDDECVVGSDWISIIISDIIEFQPCFMGGPYIGAFLPGDRPRWYKIEYGDAHFLDFHFERGFQDNFRASGGNMIVRRDVFDGLSFDTAFGKTGSKTLRLGEEIELQEQFLLDHPSQKIFYEPAIILQHFILPEKMRLSYRALRIIAEVQTSPDRVDGKAFLIAFGKLLISVPVYSIISLTKCIWRDRVLYPFWQNYIYERAIPRTCYNIGTLIKYLRDRFSSRES